ncbi:MAG: glycosyltransferase family 4 protein [Prevotellaceae bacterium]|jgi:glycosyltransferase involved in cell wall biosynthesis|nr:glycosyltransferase family 4 protein [Prevotellaceae bacterium]
MKIAYLLGALRRGGTETLMLDVFRNAQCVDYQFIGIHRKDGEHKAAFYASGQKLYKIAPRFPFDPVYLYRLRKALKIEQIDIVHAQQTLDTLYAWIATAGLKIKIVQTFHGFDCFNKKSKLLSFTAKRTDRNLFVSNYLREYYTKKYRLNPQKQQTVYNGISFEKFDKSYSTPDFLQQAGKDGLRISMIGNFVHVREHASVCRFLKLLKEKKVKGKISLNFNFYFVGLRLANQAYLYDDCVKYCEENDLMDCVHFVGGRDDVPAILQNIDAFIYSTDHDTFGIAVVEAIACKIPTFVNDFEVMKEITENGKCATIYKTKNENDLLEKFLLFLQNQNLYKENAKNAAKIVREKYSIETFMANLAKEYFDLKKKDS